MKSIQLRLTFGHFEYDLGRIYLVEEKILHIYVLALT